MTANRPRTTAGALAVVTAILFAVLSGEPAGQAAVVRVGSELEFPPYAFVDKDGQAAGFSVNLIRAVTEAMGLQIEVTSGSWDLVWNRLVAGQLDVLPIVAKLSNRAQLVDFSLSHTETYDAFFVRRGSPAFATIEAARGKEIVVMRSDAAHHALVERHFQGRLILVDTVPAGLSLVASGQHDAFLCSKLIGTLSLQKLGDSRISAGPPIPDYKRTFCFAVKRGDSELLEKLNQGLLIIKANGEYQRIYDRWLGTEDPWSKWNRYLAPVALVLVAVFLAGVAWLITVRRLVQRTTRELAEKNAQLRQIQDGLETVVAERTANLHLANTRLQTEIAEREQTEQTLQLNQSWLKLAHQAANAGAWDWDMNSSRLQWSPELFALFGLDPDRTQATFETWHQVLHPGDRETASAKIEQAIKERIPLSSEYRVVCPNGQVRWIHAVGNTSYDSSGQPVRMTGLCTDTTARKQAEEALQLTRFSVEAASDQVFWITPDACIVDVNAAACRVLGYKKEELLQLKVSDVETHYDAENWTRHFTELRQRGSMTYESEQRTKDGRLFPVEIVANYVKHSSDERNCAFVRDITERKKAQATLAHTSEMLRRTGEMARVGGWELDLATNKMSFSREALLINEVDPLVGLTLEEAFDRVDSKYRPLLQAAVQAAIKNGEPFDLDLPLLTATGRHIWTRTQGFPLMENDKTVKLFGAFQDITARKQAETALSASRTRLALATRAGGVGVWDYDVTANQLVWDEQMFQLYGITREQFSGAYEAWRAGVHPEDRQRSDDETQAALRGEKEFDTEFRVLWPDGSTHYIRALAAVERDAAGQAVRMVGTNWDITVRKQAEERLRKQVALLDSTSDAIYVRTLDHTLTYWNDGATRLYGWSAAETVGRKLTELGLVEPVGFATAHTALLAQGNWSGEVHKTGKDGKEHVVFSRWTLLRDEQGQPNEVLAINTDITDKKQLESRYLRAQRMEGIGMLAGGLAHDLNNILTPILMSAPLLREAVRDAGDLEIIDSVENSARRGTNIIRQLLTFARGQPGVRAPILVRQLLREIEKLIRETFPRNLRLAVSVPPELWPVLGDATQIHQALMNLCVNARDAMPDGGALTLATDNATLDATSAAQIPDAKPGPHVRLWVSDTGTGISPEQLERIFDPFFTTKEIGKGTGLGLATVLGIVRGHGGAVQVASRVGQGTTVELYLPASPEAAAAAMPERESKLPRGHGELILVVDDEAAVRGLAQYVLGKYGYRVLTAAEGGEALKLFDRHRLEIKAVLTDMMMPGIDGPKLVRALRQLDARLPILGMTGLIERGTFKGLDGLDSVPLLAKPFELENLLDALHQILIPGNSTAGPAN